MTTYFVNISRPVSNVRVYTIKKSLKGETNALSKFVLSLLDKYVTKKGGEQQ